jgi:rhodanese-related sulfurtransferase
MNTISAAELHERYRRGEPVELLDVRTPAEFRAVHVSFARNVPLERLHPTALENGRNGSRTNPVYVICHRGARGAKACAALEAAGCHRATNVEGGTEAWIAAGLPVERGQKTISLERQVRIAAGLLVLTGSLLGYLVHPYFIGLAAFVGAGLAFAGITNTCGMAMLLARMPWNQHERDVR